MSDKTNFTVHMYRILQIWNQVWNDENNRGYKYDLAAINFMVSLVLPKDVCNIHMHRRQHIFEIEEETMKTGKFGLWIIAFNKYNEISCVKKKRFGNDLGFYRKLISFWLETNLRLIR